jgi:hypothetical protein
MSSMSEYDPNGDEDASIVKVWADYGKETIKHVWEQGSILRKPKELFLIGSNEIQYTALPGPSCIRLLKIEPGKPGSVLRCSLHLVDLDQVQIYTTLSYTWKDLSAMQVAGSMANDTVKRMFRGERVEFGIPEDTEALQRTKPIMCNGKVIKIYANLYDALVQLRRRHPGDYWVDALCINQRYYSSHLNTKKEKSAH